MLLRIGRYGAIFSTEKREGVLLVVDDRRRSDDLFEPESLSLGHCLRLGHAGYVILQSSATLCIFAVRECGS